jgi:hypothetical protein
MIAPAVRALVQGKPAQHHRDGRRVAWPQGLASGFRLAVSRLDRLDTKSAFDLEE